MLSKTCRASQFSGSTVKKERHGSAQNRLTSIATKLRAGGRQSGLRPLCRTNRAARHEVPRPKKRVFIGSFAGAPLAEAIAQAIASSLSPCRNRRNSLNPTPLRRARTGRTSCSNTAPPTAPRSPSSIPMRDFAAYCASAASGAASTAPRPVTKTRRFTLRASPWLAREGSSVPSSRACGGAISWRIRTSATL